MKRFKFVYLPLFALLLLTGCKERADPSSPKKVHWDRDMCERCKMVLSDRRYAVEIINPKSGKAYYFDDIGCGVLWLEEERIPWADSAKIWVKESGDDKADGWIDAEKALFVGDALTPMAYGFGAFREKSFPKDKKVYRFDEVKKIIKEIEKRNSQVGRVPN
jgi:nitrous oxide reductase accessory protein NosL